jgi:hypothetical protein
MTALADAVTQGVVEAGAYRLPVVLETVAAIPRTVPGKAPLVLARRRT